MALEPTLVVPAAVLAVAGLVDLRTREIPDVLPLALVGWAAAARWMSLPGPTWAGAALGLGVGLLVGLLPFALGVLGGGDVKLVAALGAAVGPLAILVISAWIAVAGGVLALLACRRKQPELAYAPAIALGYAVAVWLA